MPPSFLGNRSITGQPAHSSHGLDPTGRPSQQHGIDPHSSGRPSIVTGTGIGAGRQPAHSTQMAQHPDHKADGQRDMPDSTSMAGGHRAPDHGEKSS